MKIFDYRQNICDYDSECMEDLTEESLDKLDEMLTAAGLEHMFTLPTQNDAENLESLGKTAQAAVWFMEDHSIEFSLVYLLWCRQIRKCSELEIAKAESRLVVHWNEDHPNEHISIG